MAMSSAPTDYKMIPPKYRDSIQETLMGATASRLVLDLEMAPEEVVRAIMTLKLVDVPDQPEREEGDPKLGGILMLGDTQHVEMSYELLTLMNLWKEIRGEMVNGKITRNTYLFAARNRPKFTEKTCKKGLARWGDAVLQDPRLFDVGVKRGPRATDIQVYHAWKGGDIRDHTQLEHWSVAYSQKQMAEENCYKAVVFGGSHKYISTAFIPGIRRYGIKVIKHYPVGSKNQPSLPEDTDFVLLIREWIGHAGTTGIDAAISLARAKNVPWVQASKRTAVTAYILRNLGYVHDTLEDSKDEIKAALQDQVDAGVGYLQLTRLENWTDAGFSAWVEDKTKCPPIDDTIYSRAKAAYASLPVVPEADPVKPDEPTAPVEPEEDGTEELTMLLQSVSDSRKQTWFDWSKLRLDHLEEKGIPFTLQGVDYRTVRCPSLPTKSGQDNKDKGQIIVAWYPRSGGPVLVSDTDEVVFALAAEAMGRAVWGIKGPPEEPQLEYTPVPSLPDPDPEEVKEMARFLAGLAAEEEKQAKTKPPPPEPITPVELPEEVFVTPAVASDLPALVADLELNEGHLVNLKQIQRWLGAVGAESLTITQDGKVDLLIRHTLDLGALK